METFAAEPIVDTTDKSDSEELELMLVEVHAKHGVYTSDLNYTSADVHVSDDL